MEIKQRYSSIIWARPNFRWSELRCKGCDGTCSFSAKGQPIAHIANAALDKLQDLRLRIRKPVTVLSAARCPLHNARVGGAPFSQHRSTDGRASTAFDVIADTPLKAIVEAAEDVGFGGIGTYSTFIHIDDRGTIARW